MNPGPRRRLDRWLGDFASGSVNLRLLLAAASIAVATVFVKAVAAAKELLVAYRLGTAPDLDAFLLAYMFPAFLVGVLSGSLQAAFVPRFLEADSRGGPGASHRLASSFAALLLACLVAATVVLSPLLSAVVPVLARGFAPDTIQQSQQFLWLLMPLLVINGLAGFWASVLNARERFMPVALAGALTPVIIMLTLWLAWPWLGSRTLVFGTLAGAVLELFVLALLMAHARQGLLSIRVRLDADHAAVVRQFLPAAMGSVLMGGTLLVDQTMAAWLEPGSVAALNYGSRVTLVLVGVGTMALGTAALPYFSRMVAQRDWGGVRATFRTYTRLIIVTTVPLTLLLVLATQPVIRALFERGAFSARDTLLVSDVQAMFALQIPFYTWSILAVRLLSAMGANSVLMWGALLSLVLDVALNLLFSRYLGVAGIALATSCVYAVACGYFLLELRRRLPGVAGPGEAK